MTDKIKDEKRKGKVWLVGAGPGDAGLFTLKGRKVLEQAEVVLYDKLVGHGIRSMIPKGAKLIDVGKKAGHHPIPQDRINEILLEEALQGQRVVRLKGGDPFLFGRGGEELELLCEHGIPFEIVPGVTSAISVPAYAGIPVTHRDFCSSLHIITGHARKGKESEIDFEALIRTKGTLVFLMGVTALDRICAGLLEAGMDPQMPAAVLERGTTAKQRRVVSTVSGLPEAAEKAAVQTPAIIVVGKVCGLADQFHWAEDRDLAGLRIIVTRPQDRASALTEKLQALGVEVVEIPSIETQALAGNEPLKKALRNIGDYGWVAFTSPAGVNIFFDQMKEERLDIRSLSGLKFTAIGSATAKAIEDRGILVDLVPETYDAVHFGAELAERIRAEVSVQGNSLGQKKLLIPRAKIGTPTLLDALKKENVDFDDIPVYDTIYIENQTVQAAEMLAEGAVDYAAFTSASTVEGFVRAAVDADYSGLTALCIGAQTAEAAQRHGMKTVVAEKATMDSMIDCLLQR